MSKCSRCQNDFVPLLKSDGLPYKTCDRCRCTDKKYKDKHQEQIKEYREANKEHTKEYGIYCVCVCVCVCVLLRCFSSHPVLNRHVCERECVCVSRCVCVYVCGECNRDHHSEFLRAGMHAPPASCQRELTLSTKSRQREEALDGLKHGFWTLECVFRGNVGIHSCRAHGSQTNFG